MTTYNTLTQDVQDFAEYADVDFVAEIPTFIDRAEKRLTRELDTIGTVQHDTTTTFTASNAFVSKPAQDIVIKSIFFIASDERQPLIRRTTEFCNDYWPNRTTTGTPKYWTDYSATQILVVPTPASNNTLDIEYIGRLTALSSGNQSNWLSTNAYDLLLAATMIEAYNYMKNYTDAIAWEGKYQALLVSYNNWARIGKRDDQKKPQNPSGGEADITNG